MNNFSPRLTDCVQQATAMLDLAIAEHDPSHVFALLSGGNDSLCVTDVVMDYGRRHPGRAYQVAHINTGIGVEETRQFVRDSCRTLSWPLKEYHAPFAYDEIVLTRGFPGPAAHGIIYSKLKERCVNQLVREHKTHLHDRILLVTGARREESVRRMGNVIDIRRQYTRVWVNALADWTKTDVLDYKAARALPHNEVPDILHMSGECLCGCFAKAEELATLRVFYPEVAERIERLQMQASALGLPCQWGKRPGGRVRRRAGELCTSCDAHFAEEER